MRLLAIFGTLCLISGPALSAEISPSDIATLPQADVLFLGEVHDNPIHHRNQADAVRALQPKALVFEMLDERQALAIRPEMLDDPNTLSAALDWESSGWPPFEMYHPIFAGAPDAAVFGGAAERSLVRQALSDGAAEVFGAGASIFGLDRALDDREQSVREAEQMAAHCDAMPINMLQGMVEAQRLRDAYLARAVLAALAETQGPVVVITGNGHARKDWGVPALLEIASPELNVISIGQFEQNAWERTPFDHWIVTASVAREDPCAAFK